MIVSIAVFELKYLNLVGLISGQNGKWEIEGVILYQFSLCNLLAQKNQWVCDSFLETCFIKTDFNVW